MKVVPAPASPAAEPDLRWGEIVGQDRALGDLALGRERKQ